MKLIFENWKTFLDEESKTRKIYYHGTTTKHLRSILKQGLVYDPRRKNYIGESSRSWETYGGTYFSPSFSLAFEVGGINQVKGYNDNVVVVGVTLDPRTQEVYLDEDELFEILTSATNITESSAFFYNSEQPISRGLHSLKIAIQNHAHTPTHRHTLVIRPEIFPSLIELINNSLYDLEIKNFLEIVRTRINIHENYEDKFYEDMSHSVNDLIKKYFLHLLSQRIKLSINNKMYTHYEPGVAQKILDLFPNVFQNLVQATDIVSKQIKKYAFNHKTSIRTKEQIGFSGKNRIVVIGEAAPFRIPRGLSSEPTQANYDNAKIMKVKFHYSENDAVKQEWLTGLRNIGNWDIEIIN